jgi:hypothetical protein
MSFLVVFLGTTLDLWRRQVGLEDNDQKIILKCIDADCSLMSIAYTKSPEINAL